MVRLQIDSRRYEVPEGKNLLDICLSLGLELPYFCWHPALGSVGACRQCAVKEFRGDDDSHGKLVMSCMTPAKEGLRISVSDPEAVAFRKAIIEWLMLNHPHDCPVCDEGGECHLQDMTVMTGHTYRRYRFRKRTFRDQNLGPFVNHEMNRCIACYRCVRFYRDYAGGHDLNVFAAHDHVYFGRQEDGCLENEFSGNLVEVCPTGVFTDKTFKKHYTRKWDLQSAPSICVHCSLGCNTLPGERYGMLRRIRNRYNQEINGYFLCDRGRYGYEFVNSDRRIRAVWSRGQQKTLMQKVSPLQAVTQLGALLSIPDRLTKTIGIGSPRASLEANFALRSLVGAERFYSGFSDLDRVLTLIAVQVLEKSRARPASLQQLEQSDCVLVLGEDVTNTAPRVALAIRQTTGPIFVSTPYRTKLDEVATLSVTLAPDDIAGLGFAIAHQIDPAFPSVQGFSTEIAQSAQGIAQALLKAKRPVIVSGTGSLSPSILEAAATLSSALFGKNAATQICFSVCEANSIGLALLEGNPLRQAVDLAKQGAVETLFLLENDLSRRLDENSLKTLLSNVKTVILLDHTATAMLPRADVIFPAATFAESDGILINNEGRAQKFYQIFVPNPVNLGELSSIQESWRWLRDLHIASARMDPSRWTTLDELTEDLVKEFPKLSPIQEAAPPASYRIAGSKIARQDHRFSGRTAIFADKTIREPPPSPDPDTPFLFSMEGAPLALALNDGWPGKKVFGDTTAAGISFPGLPLPFSPQEDQWWVIPLYHIFGSEELSLASPSIAGLAPKPYIAIHPRDAAKLGIQEGDPLEILLAGSVSLQTEEFHLPTRFESSLPLGIAGIPVGIPILAGKVAQLPFWCELSKHKMLGVA